MNLITWQLLIKKILSVTKSRFMSIIMMKIHYEKSNGFFFVFVLTGILMGVIIKQSYFGTVFRRIEHTQDNRLLYITILLLMVCSIPRIKPTQILNKNTIPLAVTTRHGIWLELFVIFLT